MRRMKRLLILSAASIGAIAVALPATAAFGRAVHGQVSAVSPTSISVSGPGGATTTCTVGRRSPSVSGVAVGDTVRMLCVGGEHGQAFLVKLQKEAGGSGAAPAKDSAPVKFGGVITSLDGSSITLHDGGRDLTCTLGDGSPSTAGLKVGQHVKAMCANGALVAIAPLGPGDVGRFFVGQVVTLTDGVITLQTEHGQVTCSINASSPSTAAVKVGDKVGMGCVASSMTLVLLRPAPTGDGQPSGGDHNAPPPPPGGADSPTPL